MGKDMKVLKAKCIHCKKEIFSLYEKQLINSKDTHERWCKFNPVNKEVKKNE